MRRERITITIRTDVLKKIDSIIDGVKIRNRSNAIETMALEKFKHSVMQKAVILGADQGVKLAGKIIPKILLPIEGKTLIERNIQKLQSIGVIELILVVGEWRKEIERILGDEQKIGLRIMYYEKADGTAAVLRHLKHELGGTFFMANGDILLDTIDLEEMYLFHKRNKGRGTIAVSTHSDPTALGSIYMKGNAILDFKEKIAEKAKHTYIVNAGVYILDPSVCDLVPEGFAMVEHDVFPKLAQKGQLFGYQVGEKWVHLHDLEKWEDYVNNCQRET